LKISRSEPGFVLSAVVHVGLLGFLLVNFSQDPKFDDAQEAVPVETITDAQFSQIMKGEKAGKEQNSKLKVDKVAEKEESKPTPPTPEAKRDAPTPPPPLKRLPDPSQAEDKPPTPTPPVPPPRPVTPPPVAKAPPQDDKEEPEQDDAEVIKQKPKPKPPEKAEAKPPPPTPPKKLEPKPPKLDEVAKLLSETHEKPAPKPKSGQESNERPSPNLSEISKLLSHDRPQSQGSTGRDLNKVASIGAPHASAAKMSPSLSDALNGLLQDQYKQCWSYLGLSNGPKYVPRIRVSYRPDGSLAGEPSLTNPASDPASRSLADSALRAVKRCNPLKIPAQFQPFYEQWKDWVVGFNPDDMN
jgi:colicin import membrane protein